MVCIVLHFLTYIAHLPQIYKRDQVVASRVTPDLLSCQEHRQFYITRMDNTIRVHKYDGAGSLVIDWFEEGGYAISSAALRTGPWSTGEWIVDRETGRWIGMLTLGTSSLA